MNKQEKISINGVPETMLQTMYARAKETKKENAVIHDEKAVEIVEKLDYDFTLADKDAAMGSGVIARTILLDKMVADYLKKHPEAIVVNIACGLDTRCYRNEGKYKRWYNIDLPDTINVRSRFMEEQGPEIYQFAESAMDESWADKIEYTGESVLVIIEGLTMYLSEEDVKKIFDIIDKKLIEKEEAFIPNMKIPAEFVRAMQDEKWSVDRAYQRLCRKNLLVEINYDKDSKEHKCSIEEVE